MLSRKRAGYFVAFHHHHLSQSLALSLPLSWLDFSLMTKPFMSLLCFSPASLPPLPPVPHCLSLILLAIYASSVLFFCFFFYPSRSLSSLILNLRLPTLLPPLSFFALLALTSRLFFPSLSPRLHHSSFSSSSPSSLSLLHHFLSKHLLPPPSLLLSILPFSFP